MKNVHDLTDEELESCFDGTTSTILVREILKKHGVVDDEGFIDPEIFADWFADGIKDFIGEEEDTPEYTEIFDSNWNWGYDIADNLNALISDNFKEFNDKLLTDQNKSV